MSEISDHDEAWEAVLAAVLSEAAVDAGSALLDFDGVLIRAWQLWLDENGDLPDS